MGTRAALRAPAARLSPERHMSHLAQVSRPGACHGE